MDYVPMSEERTAGGTVPAAFLTGPIAESSCVIHM